MDKQRIQDLQQQRGFQQEQHGWQQQEFQHMQKGWTREDQQRDALSGFIDKLSGLQGSPGAGGDAPGPFQSSDIDNIIRGLSPDGSSGAGGNAPAAFQTIQHTGLQLGAPPKPTSNPTLTPEESLYLRTLPPDKAAQWIAERSIAPTDEAAIAATQGLPKGVHTSIKTRSGREVTGTGQEPPFDPSTVPANLRPGTTYSGDIGGTHVSVSGRDPHYHWTDREVDTPQGLHIISEGFDPESGHTIRRDLGPAPPRVTAAQRTNPKLLAQAVKNHTIKQLSDPKDLLSPEETVTDWNAVEEELRQAQEAVGGPGAPAPGATGGQQPEGTVLKTTKGTFVKRNGQWQRQGAQ